MLHTILDKTNKLMMGLIQLLGIFQKMTSLLDNKMIHTRHLLHSTVDLTWSLVLDTKAKQE